MELFNGIFYGLQTSLSLLNGSLIILGALIGTFVGALPGFRSIHAVALMTPVVFALKLPIESALIFLLTLFHGGTYGERFISIPKENNSRRLSMLLTATCFSAFFGALTAALGLSLMMPLLDRLNLNFGPAEYFTLTVFAFSALALNNSAYPVRTAVSTCLGLMMATVGIDSTTGVLRFTLGQPQLYDGINFTTVVVGLFVVSQIFNLLGDSPPTPEPQSVQFRPEWRLLLSSHAILLRSALSGFCVGILPACGMDIGSRFSRWIERRVAVLKGRKPLDTNLLIAQECSKQAVTGGTLIPLLSLGIPGNGTSAIMLGALLLYNIPPGPNLLKHHNELIWILISALALANIALVCVNLLLARLWIQVHRIPRQIQISVFLVLAFVAGTALRSGPFALAQIVIIGLFGYLLEKYHYPHVPLLLGFVLGKLLESSLRRALSISGGDPMILFSSPTCHLFLVASMILLVIALLWQIREAVRR